MKSVPLAVLAATIASLGVAGPALAQANRTFVSGTGSDSNPCSLSAPCRSFAQALTQTNSGGDIVVLDSAGYGPVTITKSVSIVNQEGVVAGVTATSDDGITVAVGVGDVVNLRGLTVVGFGATNGINFTSFSSGTLRIDKCEIRGFATGISMVAFTAEKLTVTDTTVSGNVNGVFVETNTGPTEVTNVTLARLHASLNGGAGVVVTSLNGAAVVNVVDSLFDDNGVSVSVTTTPGSFTLPQAQVMVDNSKLLANMTGHAVTATGTANTVVYENRSLLGVGTANDNSFTGGARLVSFGNNQGNGGTF